MKITENVLKDDFENDFQNIATPWWFEMDFDLNDFLRFLA